MPVLDENMWVAIAAAAFVLLVWRRAWSAITAMLDKRSGEIRKNLDEAKALREEAQAELSKCRRMQRDANQQAKDIIAAAETAAEEIKHAAETNAKRVIARREAQANSRIKSMENQAMQEIRQHTAQLASAAAAELIAGKLDSKAASNLIKADIASITALDSKRH